MIIFIADHVSSSTHLSLVNMMSKCNLMVMYIVTQIHIRTLPSSLQKIKDKQMCSGNPAPKTVVAEITKEEGGIIVLFN